MHVFIIIFLNLFFYFYFQLSSLDPPRANGSVSESMQPFDDVILDFMTEQDIPGASVALSRDGILVYCQGINHIVNLRNSLSLATNFTSCKFAANWSYFPRGAELGTKLLLLHTVFP